MQNAENQLQKNLIFLRKSIKKTQGDIADSIKRNRTTYAKWEEGKNEPPVADLMKLAAFYKITVDQLLYGVLDKSGVPAAEIEPQLQGIDYLEIPDPMVESIERRFKDPADQAPLFKSLIAQKNIEIGLLTKLLKAREALMAAHNIKS